MRLSRTYRAILAFILVGFLCASGTARTGLQSIVPVEPPSFEAWLDYPTQSFHLLVTNGQPLAPGVFNFYVVWGPAPGFLQVPFTFDAAGNAHASYPISLLNNGSDHLVAFNCMSVGVDGLIHDSGIWALRGRNYLVTTPLTSPCAACPATAGGWSEEIEWPGTTGGPLYPHSLIAIPTQEIRGGQPMLALESGPAGSFPIN